MQGHVFDHSVKFCQHQNLTDRQCSNTSMWLLMLLLMVEEEKIILISFFLILTYRKVTGMYTTHYHLNSSIVYICLMHLLYHSLDRYRYVYRYLYIEKIYIIYTYTHTYMCRLCCSIAESCPTLCDPMDCNMSGSSILHCLLEFAQIHAHWVGDAI